MIAGFFGFCRQIIEVEIREYGGVTNLDCIDLRRAEIPFRAAGGLNGCTFAEIESGGERGEVGGVLYVDAYLRVAYLRLAKQQFLRQRAAQYIGFAVRRLGPDAAKCSKQENNKCVKKISLCKNRYYLRYDGITYYTISSASARTNIRFIGMIILAFVVEYATRMIVIRTTFVKTHSLMKKVILAIAAFALLFACTSKDGTPGGGDQEGQEQGQGQDYTNTDQLVFVDMGTKVLWATMNVGALHSTEFGSYLEWSPLTASYGDEYSDCHLPTWADYEELVSVKTSDGKYTGGPCRASWGNVNGVYGITYTNKKTGNAIFMPAAGQYSQGLPYFVGKRVYNWTLDSKEEWDGKRATATEFQSATSPSAGAHVEMHVSINRCTVRLVKEK